ncbi:hypothetical protein B0H11DRAFT_2249761 [Mycena galericulata]|nr:hypothetical protein B0H11DRAFT_2249761 [Mycena galericulata]
MSSSCVSSQPLPPLSSINTRHLHRPHSWRYSHAPRLLCRCQPPYRRRPATFLRVPWALPFLYIAALKTDAPLAAPLLSDALVSSVLLDRCRRLIPHLDHSNAGGLAWRVLWLFVNPGANDITVRTPFISSAPVHMVRTHKRNDVDLVLRTVKDVEPVSALRICTHFASLLVPHLRDSPSWHFPATLPIQNTGFNRLI